MGADRAVRPEIWAKVLIHSGIGAARAGLRRSAEGGVVPPPELQVGRHGSRLEDALGKELHLLRERPPPVALGARAHVVEAILDKLRLLRHRPLQLGAEPDILDVFRYQYFIKWKVDGETWKVSCFFIIIQKHNKDHSRQPSNICKME